MTEVKNNGDGLITLKVIDGGAVAPAIIKAFTQMNLNVTRLTLARPTMDEVYMTYTGRNLREEQATSEETFTMKSSLLCQTWISIFPVKGCQLFAWADQVQVYLSFQH